MRDIAGDQDSMRYPRRQRPNDFPGICDELGFDVIVRVKCVVPLLTKVNVGEVNEYCGHTPFLQLSSGNDRLRDLRLRGCFSADACPIRSGGIHDSKAQLGPYKSLDSTLALSSQEAESRGRSAQCPDLEATPTLAPGAFLTSHFIFVLAGRGCGH